ncbi:MAG: precorrin-3B C(17)-methyltransferase, partial [Alphaproteobacteria bacterium]
ILVTDRDEPGDANTLVLHPPTLAMGLGCERGVEPAELLALARQCLADHGLAAASIATVVSLDLKSDEAAMHEAAEAFGVEARFFDAEALEAWTPRLANPSAVVFAAVGCHGVAEGAALAASGPNGTLAVAKQRSARGTCAIARATHGIDGRAGVPRGRLFIAGTGPGDAAFRSPAVDQALAQVTDIVGYGPYIDLLGRAAVGKNQHRFDLGEEETRCRKALDLAATGQGVMLLSSGDPGIYALATLVFELLDRADCPRWNRVALDVLPGVSAMQMAAARVGAALGHDFCAISLSDLLTPWPTVMQRLEAACKADLVIALYNPTSRSRGHRFAEALALLVQLRPADTPVVVARNLARRGEEVRIIALAELDPAQVDMLTTILVGSSRSRTTTRGGRVWMYTPRGYGVSETAEKVQA